MHRISLLLALASLVLIACAPDPESTPEISGKLWLSASAGEERRTFPLTPGRTITLDGHPFTVAEIRVWRGLLSQNTGISMLHLSATTESGDVIEDAVLKPGDRWTINEHVELLFDWATDEIAMRTSVENDDPGARRWGVREGTATSWSDSFVPGTGFERLDGAVVTLMSADDDGTIEVAIETEEATTYRTVLRPGQIDASGVVNAWGSDFKHVIQIVAWRDGEGLLTARTDSEKTVVPFRVGDSLNFFNVRIDIHDVRANAVYIGPADSPWREAVLVGDERRVRVREGVVERLGNWQVNLSRTKE